MSRRRNPPGETARRGYTGQHERIREQWRPVAEAGDARCHALVCLMPTRRIPPWAPWDLGHTPDRTAWTGPEHRKCNRSAGAHASHRARWGRARALATTQRW